MDSKCEGMGRGTVSGEQWAMSSRKSLTTEDTEGHRGGTEKKSPPPRHKDTKEYEGKTEVRTVTKLTSKAQKR